MKVLLQVVKEASVTIEEKIYSQIGRGFLLFVGFTQTDNEEIIHKMIDKVLSLRVFMDDNGKTNLGLNDVNGEVMCVSQFTLYADVKKGRRPSFTSAAGAELSRPLYQKTIDYIRKLGYDCKTGIFGADMKVSLINDGPFTIAVEDGDLV